jgi:hypothetical protein
MKNIMTRFLKAALLALCFNVPFFAEVNAQAQYANTDELDFYNYRERVPLYPGVFLNGGPDREYDSTLLNTFFMTAGGSFQASCPLVGNVNVKPIEEPMFLLDVQEEVTLRVAASNPFGDDTELVLLMVSKDMKEVYCIERAENSPINTLPVITKRLRAGMEYGLSIGVTSGSPVQDPGFGLFLEILE